MHELPGGIVTNNPPANPGGKRDVGSIPAGRYPGLGNSNNPLGILAWKIPGQRSLGYRVTKIRTPLNIGTARPRLLR